MVLNMSRLSRQQAFEMICRLVDSAASAAPAAG
jgi:hypothetical protein